jgi:SRSO17 transposase
MRVLTGEATMGQRRSGQAAPRAADDWSAALDQWFAPFVEALGHKGRQRWGPLYLAGLLGPGDRKSVQPMAARVAPADHEQLHHFIATSAWDPAPLETLLAHEAERLVGGPDAVLIVDDTSLLKQGRHSVGVARQYSGQAGKTTNCQCLVSLTLAREEVPVPVALRLHLPTEWIAAPVRLERAGVPSEWRTARTRSEVALAELDRVRAAGIRAATVLADAGYGMGRDFRQGLTQRGYTWAVGIVQTQGVYPATVHVPVPRTRAVSGRPRKFGTPSHVARSAAAVLATAQWRTVTWRRGTRGPLSARFAAVQIRVADGPRKTGRTRQPGDLAWLVGEERAHGVRKYYLCNHPEGTPLRTLAGVIKARWVCEQAHQQMKEELGLDHFEGRSWLGLHHHALFSMLAFAFLQHERLQAGRGKKNAGRAAAGSVAPRRAPRATRAGLDPAPPMSAL